jgi:GntR family transcriptional regulator, galactonate operon transcriptional repressor
VYHPDIGTAGNAIQGGREMAETLFTIVKDARLHEEVGRQIARRIVLGDFPVGSYLPAESELIARFGVSRMVIREALRSLEECGMIAVRHGRRTIVAPKEEWDVLNRLVLTTYRDEGLIEPLLRDSLRVRRILEPAIAAEAAEKATPELLAALAACLERQAAALDTPDAFLEEDLNFHNLLVSATDNRILARMLTAIRDLLHVSREVTNQLPNALPGALLSHQRIYDEVRSGDPDRAHRAMLDHLDRTGPAYVSLGRSEAQESDDDASAPNAAR